MPTLHRDRIDLAYEIEGDGSRPMVFVHGWACDRRYLRPQIEYFAGRGCTTASLDLRGHGESSAPVDASYTIADFAADVGALIAHLGLERPLAVGHSMGGITVLQLAATQPEAVGAIAMIDPASLTRPPDVLAKRTEMLDSLRAGDRTRQRDFIERRMFLPTDDPERREEIVADMLADPAHVSAAAMESINAFDGTGAAALCRVPALHIGAARPLNPIGRFEEHLPGVVSGQTVGAGHFNQLLVPDQVNDMIERFAEIHHWGPAAR